MTDSNENKTPLKSDLTALDALKVFRNKYIQELHKRTQNGLKLVHEGKLKEKDKELLEQLVKKLSDFNVIYARMFEIIDDINIFINKTDKYILNKDGKINKILMEKQAEMFNELYSNLKKYELCQLESTQQK